MKDEATPLGSGRFETRLAVDRRRLESMITGKPFADDDFQLPNATLFFDQVMQISGATVIWPTQLKIGAKTKRDPFVKLQGTLEQIEKAKLLIMSTLHCKKERVTLKVDIHHSIHSHIIGKGGRVIQQIMRNTKCHIHFPDSNKFSAYPNRSDQVSISGGPHDVNNALRLLRAISPVVLTIELPWMFPGTPESFGFPENFSFQRLSSSTYICIIRGSTGDESSLQHSYQLLIQHFSIPSGFPVVVKASVPLKEDVISILNSSEHFLRLEKMMDDQKVKMQINNGFAQLSGSLDAVLFFRKYLIGYSPACLTFDLPLAYTANIALVEKTFDVTITTKKRSNQPGTIVSVMIKTAEAYIATMFRARDVLMGNESGDDYSGELDLSNPLPDDYISLHNSSGSPVDPLSSLQSLSYPINTLGDTPKSPDPDNSPLAASILKGVKNIETKGDRWLKRQPITREEMLAKAAQALFDEPSGDRYPTDHWAGYGFSCSLPAELLKNFMDVNDRKSDCDRNIMHAREPKLSMNRGLCSVREEDELSDFSGSFSSTSINSGQRNYDSRDLRKGIFSASTSIFDVQPALIGDLSWDIRIVTDPAMVLAQLGCSEYLAQMREQEIDMHAFLLLDEQSLKDIGVSTIGARKKIHHAIIKLRDSARLHGIAV